MGAVLAAARDGLGAALSRPRPMVPRCLAVALRPALRPPRLLAALGARHASRDSAAHGMVAKEHDAALLITTLPTVPGAQLTVAGQCASLTVKTNMETYVAEAWAEVDGQACDARTVADFDVSEGAIRVSVTEALARLTLTVPAAFEVSVGMSRGACDVDVAGWLEGCVDVSTDSGSVSVQTVKGVVRVRAGQPSPSPLTVTVTLTLTLTLTLTPTLTRSRACARGCARAHRARVRARVRATARVGLGLGLGL